MRYLFILLIFISFSGFSQFGFDKIDHDFGDIYAGNERVIDIKFRNTTNKTVYLLRIQHDHEIRTLVSGKKIEPDSLLIIRVKYNPSETGKFNIEIPIFLSNSLEPFVFTIEGDVKEIDNTMGLACPSFDNKTTNPTPIFDFTATVIDAQTGERIENASVTFISNGTVSKIEKTNKNGQVKTVSLIGLYYFVIQADGYIGKEFPKYVNRNNDSILVYLDKPMMEEPIVLKEPEPIVTDDTLTKTTFLYFPDTQEIAAEEPIISSEDTVKEKEIIPILDTQVIVKQEPIPTLDTVKPKTEKPQTISYKSNNIVFLLDVSTSMNTDGKLDLLKSSLIEMVKELRPEDRITLITYSTFSKVIIEAASGADKEKLIETIQGIKAQGMTAGGDGMKLAYRQAREHFIPGGNNQVIMATDGRFNKGNTNLDRLVKKNFDRGIGLTVLGIKNKPEDAQSMQQIASIGGGNFLLIENYEDSKEILIKEIKRTSRVVE